jgi:hypothetical protein
MSRSAWRVAAVPILAVALASPASAQTFFTDFETDPTIGGWYLPFADTITNTQSYSPSHSALVSLGLFYSPQFNYPQGQYVSVQFHALSPLGDQVTGRAIYSSGLSVLQPGTGWTNNTYVFRSNGVPNDRVVFLTGSVAVPVYFDDITLQPISRTQAAQIQDANFAALMPMPFTYTAPANRQTFIPNAMARLAAGQTMTPVLVGDSIIGDLASTSFDAMAERHTGGKINVTFNSVGGAGATYWAQNNLVAGIMAANPDLFMFGGISQQPDIPSLRSIIQQARAANPNIEIVLMSPIAGTENNPFTDPSLALPAAPNGTSYRSQMIQLAAEQSVQYWDLETPFNQYILNSGLQYNDFLRDGIHLNGRGDMLAAAVMESFFAPVPEPSTLLLTGLAGAAMVTAWRRRKAKSAD